VRRGFSIQQVAIWGICLALLAGTIATFAELAGRSAPAAPVVAAPANPTRPAPVRFAETRQNLIANPSVEVDLTGWSSFTSDQELTVNYRRDDRFGSHGAASLRQDIVNSLNASPRAAAYWIYPVAADPSWWGRSVSASMDARTTTTDLVPMLVLEFWQDDTLLAVEPESDPAAGLTPNAWSRHRIEGVAVPEGTTQIRVIGLTHVEQPSAVGVMWFDAFVLELGDVAGPYLEPIASPAAPSPVASPATPEPSPIALPTATRTAAPTPSATGDAALRHAETSPTIPPPPGARCA